MDSPILSIRISTEMASELESRRKNQSLNISAFCRRAIERQLAQVIVDAEPQRNTAVVLAHKPLANPRVPCATEVER